MIALFLPSLGAITAEREKHTLSAHTKKNQHIRTSSFPSLKACEAYIIMMNSDAL